MARRTNGLTLLLKLGTALALASVLGASAGRGASPVQLPVAERRQVTLRQGQYLGVAVLQRGADVAVALRDPAGRVVLDVDSPNSHTGTERLDFVAEQAGEYQIEVRQRSAERGGSFKIQIGAPRPATALDALRARACGAASDAAHEMEAHSAEADRRALPLLRLAAQLWRAAGDAMSEALVETRLGQVLLRLGQPGAALDCWQQALALLRRSELAFALPTLHNQLGQGYVYSGQPALARGAFERALVSSRRVGDHSEEAGALCNLAGRDQIDGDDWQALARYDEALALARQYDDQDRQAQALAGQGYVLMVLGKLAAARESLGQSARLYHRTGPLADEVSATLELGWAALRAGETEPARRLLHKALALARLDGNARNIAVVLGRLGSLEEETGAFAKAAADLKLALQGYKEAGDAPAQASGLSNLGLAQFMAGDAAGGQRSLDQAVKDLEKLGMKSGAANARCRRALCERALGRLDAAKSDVETGLSGLDAIRDQAESDDLRRSYLDSVHDQYELLVDILMDMHAARPAAGFDQAALAAAERGRARGLLDLIAGARQRGMPRDNPALQALLAVDDRIRAAEVPAVPSQPPAPEVLRGLFAQREAAVVALRAPAPDGALTARVLSAGEIRRQVLDDQTVLLAYSLGDSRSFVWALTRDGLQTAVLPARGEIEELARSLRAELIKRAASARLAGAVGRKLSQILLEPVAAALAGRRIAVVPDGALFYVPFADLPAPGSAGQLLIDRHEVVVVPSASVLAAVRQRAARRRAPPRQLAVLADPLIPTAAGDGRSAQAGGGAPQLPADFAHLPPLPASRQEGETILGLVPPGQRLSAMGAEASRGLLLSGALQPYSILHFATHALIDPSVPELSGMLLATVDRRGRPAPGFVQSFEIAELRLPADLVVLSACSTALGQELRGEGLVGLTQSFFQAGASRVVVSLWDVDDRATAAVMQRFYREMLRGGSSPAAALRSAQLALRRDPRYSEPRFWAGFELQGDWRPLPWAPPLNKRRRPVS